MRRFLALPHPGLAVYRNCIELELNLASAADKHCLVKVRKLFESTLATYAQDVGLWKDYYNMECKVRLILLYDFITSDHFSVLIWSHHS